ncbi:MAG TPA: beta-eliminating lyase-related protein [Chloroflexia bacterium]|nr:beta-eliminating lyase-related protein [Chloroflexia bacterium]
MSGHKRLPPREWLQALADSPLATLPPDLYGEGAAIASLEGAVAEMLGQEAGVFVMKGIIAQLVALRVWTDRAQCRTVALHPLSHIDLDEGDAYERLHPLHGIRLGGRGPFTVADLEGVRERLGVVVVELPLRRAGFKLPSWEELVAISTWCRARNVPLHFDGARLWETAPFFGRPYAEIAALADSIYVSLYKGVAGLAGCVLAGPADFIAEARVWKKRHGGDLPTAFPYVIAASEGMREHLPRMAGYCARARELAALLGRLPGATVVPDPPHTNAFQLLLPGRQEELEQAALALAEEQKVWLFGHLAATDVPDRWMCEVSVGNSADELTNEEVAALFHHLLDRAAARGRPATT